MVAPIRAPTERDEHDPGAGADPAHGFDRARRFGGVARLYGDQALDRLAVSRVVVVGIGGVGSWAVEALARSGVGRLGLVDMDHVAESNINRQVHALEDSLGRAKVDVMAERIARIAPDCRVERIDDFIDADNVAGLIDPEAGFVIDAIDAPRAKAALIALCVRRAQPLVVCGAAGGRVDPLSLRRDDLSRTRNDRLLASVRARLRRDHGFAREPGSAFHVPVVYSDAQAAASRAGEPNSLAGAPLACAGYGSIVTVTASMGFAAAAIALERLLTPGR